MSVLIDRVDDSRQQSPLETGWNIIFFIVTRAIRFTKVIKDFQKINGRPTRCGKSTIRYLIESVFATKE
ncbi:hypothetical protein HY546_00285 [archaeon]|nr:hypothetical protein [archaeon]